MNTLNELSIKVLNRLWELADKNDGYYKLNNDPTFTPLTIEIIGRDELSICHYGEMNGDLMRDPEMVFWKFNGNWLPTYFRNDYGGVEDWSIRHEFERVEIDNRVNRSHIEFSNLWLSNIMLQQLGEESF
jgi:hypothetical protein